MIDQEKFMMIIEKLQLLISQLTRAEQTGCYRKIKNREGGQEGRAKEGVPRANSRGEGVECVEIMVHPGSTSCRSPFCQSLAFPLMDTTLLSFHFSQICFHISRHMASSRVRALRPISPY